MTIEWNAAPSPQRNTHPLVVRDHSLSTALGLLTKSLPYALMRFGIELGFAVIIRRQELAHRNHRRRHKGQPD